MVQHSSTGRRAREWYVVSRGQHLSQDCVKAAEQGMSECATQAAFRQKHLETSVWAQSMVIRTSQSSAMCGNQATFCHVSPQQGSGLGYELCHRLALQENQCLSMVTQAALDWQKCSPD